MNIKNVENVEGMVEVVLSAEFRNGTAVPGDLLLSQISENSEDIADAVSSNYNNYRHTIIIKVVLNLYNFLWKLDAIYMLGIMY